MKGAGLPRFWNEIRDCKSFKVGLISVCGFFKYRLEFYGIIIWISRSERILKCGLNL
ncbi:hypothetical protein LSS_22940 [Leptospira santarosai serovar Shermani str. LT 821]|uniref:Uncharacterized protein n=1 Tax=Leptospira santarosai serovar Shermani str. LT 821 TaxID=758847 RepID=A0A097ESZ1_9LEPT|nr:hypothetical protein LSS_22940 [Leptospira santarosai serovar Shermani str. LT 821]